MTNKNKSITIKPYEIINLAKEGGKLMFKPAAEKHLIRLLKIKTLIDRAIDHAKEQIAIAGEELMPNFKGVVGADVRCIYRAYGGKYGLDLKELENMDPRFYKPRTSYSVDSKAIDDFVKKHGGLPLGIYERERSKTLSIKLIEEKKKLK